MPTSPSGWKTTLTGIKPAPDPLGILQMMGGIEYRQERSVLQQLQKTADHGDLLAPFAKLLLAVAAFREKDTTPKAATLLHELAYDLPRQTLSTTKEMSRCK